MRPPVIDTLLQTIKLAEWKTVPTLVASRIKQASDIQRAVQEAVNDLPAMQSGYTDVFWHPDKHELYLVVGDGDTSDDIDQWIAALSAVDGVKAVRAEAEAYPDDEWIRVKKAAALSWLNAPYELAGKMTGGPSPLSNAIVSGLLGAGAGYTVGTAAEKLLPEQYFNRGKLRATLARLGATGGAMLHAPKALANMQLNSNATGSPHILRSIMRGDNAQQVDPNEMSWRSHIYGSEKAGSAAIRMLYDNLPDRYKTAAAQAAVPMKLAFDAGAFGTAGVPLHPVPVDEFNNAIWNDVDNHNRSPYAGTPPMNAAAAVGIVTGIQQQAGNPSYLSPKHFIHGLAAAGLDAATATVAGGILGALGGMKPEAQRQLQQMGMWGGLIRGVTGSVLGLH